MEHYIRQPDGHWLLRESGNPDDVIRVNALECTLPLHEVYAKVKLGSPPAGGWSSGEPPG